MPFIQVNSGTRPINMSGQLGIRINSFQFFDSPEDRDPSGE